MLLRAGVVGVWIVFIVTGMLALLNSQAVPVMLLGARIEAPLSAVIFGPLIVGALAGYGLELAKRPKIQSEKRQLEWAAQDAKLIAEVKSDREKQLEAKIATLEAALKQALGKSKS